jgi:hypothetical protein
MFVLARFTLRIKGCICFGSMAFRLWHFKIPIRVLRGPGKVRGIGQILGCMDVTRKIPSGTYIVVKCSLFYYFILNPESMLSPQTSRLHRNVCSFLVQDQRCLVQQYSNYPTRFSNTPGDTDGSNRYMASEADSWRLMPQALTLGIRNLGALELRHFLAALDARQQSALHSPNTRQATRIAIGGTRELKAIDLQTHRASALLRAHLKTSTTISTHPPTCLKMSTWSASPS